MSVPLNPDSLRSAARWAQPLFDTTASNKSWKAPLSDSERARQQADTQARSEGYESGRAEGRNAGFAQGRAEGLALAAAEIIQLRGVLQALASPLSAVDEELERVLCAMTLEAARRIAQQELSVAPERVAAVVRDAVASLGRSEPGAVRVRLNPGDHAVLLPLLADEGAETTRWTLFADADVPPGGCQVESDDASVLSSLDARAAGLAHGLLDTGGR